MHLFFPGICYFPQRNYPEHRPIAYFRDSRRDVFTYLLSAPTLSKGKGKQEENFLKIILF